MKKVLLILGACLTFCLIVALISLYWFHSSLQPVSSSSKEIEITIPSGSSYATLGTLLEKSHLIKSKFAYQLYIKIHPPKGHLKAGTYTLNQNMGVKKILEILQDPGDTFSPLTSPDEISITFQEGLNMRKIAKIIAEHTDNTEQDVFDTLSDKEYLQSLVDSYWFIDDSILNQDIYYPLEGYLFPDTYRFKNKSVTVPEIFKVLLDEMGKKLEPYRNAMESSSYSVHEILTLASIIELEATVEEDRKHVSGVFYNRLQDNISLGSDVTSYYGVKLDLSERDLYPEELSDDNPYNTRLSSKMGLPIGPICNPSLEAIVSALEPVETTDYYFISDNEGSMYFFKTGAQLEQKKAELIRDGKWERY